ARQDLPGVPAALRSRRPVLRSRRHRAPRRQLRVMVSARGGLAVLSLIALIGCRQREAPADAAPTDPTVEIAADRTDELLYLDLDGRIRRARGVAAVPVRSRHAVATEGPDGPGGALWIADVSRPAASWPAQRAT